ncbi:alkyl sulfatase C-terminal domain-containing protein [Serratia odorifera]|uniref:alkyl sulfatase C-terminal domain-containing protein n=1 Tax=Serratia odorifera TaxID=618 RepID=UPI00308119EC
MFNFGASKSITFNLFTLEDQRHSKIPVYLYMYDTIVAFPWPQSKPSSRMGCISHGSLITLPIGGYAKDADATITLSRDALNRIVLKEQTLKEEQDKGDVKITGDSQKLNELLGYMDKFDFWFNIVTP